MIRRCCACLTLAGVMLLAANVRAQSAATEGEREEARQDFQQGMEFVRQERWAEALAEFEASLRLYPTQNALFNSALCLKRLQRDAEAVTAFEEVLDRYGSEVDARRQADIERELAELRSEVGRIAVRASGVMGATVLLDGSAVGETPLPRPLAVRPGPHRLEVRVEGFEPFSREVSVETGQEAGVEVNLRPVVTQVIPITEAEPGDTPGGEETPTPIAEPRPDRVPRSRGLRLAAYITTGLAVAALGAGLGLALWNDGQYGNWENEDADLRLDLSSTATEPQDSNTLWQRMEDNERLAGSIHTMDTVAWVLLGTGGAIAVASVVFYVLGFRSEGNTRVSLVPQPGGLAFTAGWAIP